MIHFVTHILDSDIAVYRAHTFAIAAKSNYKTYWTAKEKIIPNKRIDKTYNLACYYSIPTDNTNKTLHPTQINATLCTHLIVAFAQVQNNSVYFKSSFDMQVRCFIIYIIVITLTTHNRFVCFSQMYAFSNSHKFIF